MKYIDLHIHSEYTTGNGITKIKDLIKRAKEFGMDSIALTDSGSIKGFDEFRINCKKEGIKPIFGCGFYLAPLGLDNSLTHHLVLLAKGDIGYDNILKLNDFSLKEGLGNKPRVNFEILKKYSENIIALTGGLGGVFDKPYLVGDIDLAMKNLSKLKEIYKKHLYLELQDNGLAENKKMVKIISDISKKESVETVVTGGSFYLEPLDSDECNRVRIKNGNNILKGDGYYFKSEDTILELFKNNLKAIENSLIISQNALN